MNDSLYAVTTVAAAGRRKKKRGADRKKNSHGTYMTQNGAEKGFRPGVKPKCNAWDAESIPAGSTNYNQHQQGD